MNPFFVPSPIYIPLEDEDVFCEFFQQQFSSDHNHNILAHEMTNNIESAMEECNNNNGPIATDDRDQDHCCLNTYVESHNDTPSKRHSNRDRHSKINTARGLRDRRIRLSLDVAKKLFGLQDLLGFDKASKAVDWLLTESKTAILDLVPDQGCSFMGVSNSASSNSECEVVSGKGDHFMVKIGDDEETRKDKVIISCSGSSKKQKNEITKETRVRARQRARERTTEKKNKYKINGVDQDSTFMDQDINMLDTWSTFKETENQSIDQLNNCTPTYFLDYQHSSGLRNEH